MLVGELLALPAALEGPAHLVADHLVVPVGQHVPGEPGGELHHAHPKVGVVDVQVVGHAPHQDQVDALLLQLPGDGAGGASEAGDGESDNINSGDNEEEGRKTQGEDIYIRRTLGETGEEGWGRPESDTMGGWTQDLGYHRSPGVLPIDHDHNLPVGGEHVSLVETLKASNWS